MIVFRNLFLYALSLVLTAFVSVMLLAPESLLPVRCGTEVPMKLRLALALGADPARGDKGKRLLSRAARLGNAEVVQLLLQHGVKIQNIERDEYDEPLITEVAEQCGELSMVRLLVENGAPLPPLCGSGAPEWDEIPAEVMEYLLLCGLQFPEDEDGLYSLFAGLMKHYEGREQKLAEFLKAEKIHPKLRPMVLRRAIASNNTNLVRVLLQDGVSLEEADVDAGTIVHAGCGEKKTDITELVQVLKDAGFPLNKEDENGETPLMVAFNSAHPDVYRVLVAAGADESALRQSVGEASYLAMFGTPEELAAVLPAAGEEQKQKALRVALAAERAEAVKAILASGVPLNKLKLSQVAFDTELLRERLKCVSEETAELREDISNAFNRADKEAYPMLLEAFGDINAKLSDNGFSSRLLSEALWSHDSELIRFLLKNGAHLIPETVYMCSSPADLALLLEAGWDINMRDEDGRTLLHRKSSDREMVAALLKHGVDVNAQDEDGDTVLHDAVIANEPEIVQMLLEAGADVSIRNEEGQTPEDIALEIPIGRVLRVFREFRK